MSTNWLNEEAKLVFKADDDDTSSRVIEKCDTHAFVVSTYSTIVCEVQIELKCDLSPLSIQAVESQLDAIAAKD
jgi:hypothetical protein